MAKNNSELKSIQKKLMAAIAMVLVASVMVVSSSYAWFTLSTAPEVQGIQTSVGSNGNLEMALRPLNGDLNKIVTGGTGSSNNWPDSNYFWGNLVNLDHADYGMGSITLAPARLNAVFDEASSIEGDIVYEDVITAAADTYKAGDKYNDEVIKTVEATEITEGDNAGKYSCKITTTGWVNKVYKMVTSSGFLQTPEYGTDGRISQLNANTVNGVFDKTQGTSGAFLGTGTNWGVRAVGTTSNISPEALALRNAKATVNSAIDTAKTSGRNSMKNDAIPMAQLIVQNKLQPITYTVADAEKFEQAVINLRGVVSNLEEALKQAVVAVGLSRAKVFESKDVTFEDGDIKIAGVTDLNWGEVKDGDTVVAADLTNQKADILKAAAKLAVMDGKLDQAEAAVPAAKANPSYETLYAIMSPLLKTTDIEIIHGNNVYSIEDSDKLMSIAVAMFTGSATISMKGGIYCDIAEFVGDYTQAGLKMSVDTTGSDYQATAEQVFDTAKPEVTFAMATNATAPTNGYYLVYVSTWMATLNVASESAASQLITNTYGYVVDLAFRTNAAGSSLLLQTDATDRVDANNGTDSVTMGGGSYMQFKAGNSDYTVAQMVELMDYVRVVLTDDTGTIYGIAKLDMTLTDVLDEDGNKVEFDESKHFLYKEVEEERDVVTGQDDDGNDIVEKKTVKVKYAQTLAKGEIKADGTVKAYLYLYSFSIDDGVVSIGSKLSGGAITTLEQNIAKAVSCLVYLDGDKVENKHVAISGNSMTGTMNLQFASSATLVPMDYTFAQKETLKDPSAELSGNSLTITAAAEAPTGVKYEVYASNGTVSGLVATVDAGTHTVDLSTIDELPAGEYTITVKAVHADYNASKEVTAGTITKS